MKQALVVGGGLSGSVIARELAEKGFAVTILEKRNHIGGNMYDYMDEHGIMVHKYGPHTFHTKKKELYDYICRYGEWDEFHLMCGTEINGICTPTPFNFQTIDDFYSARAAKELKMEIKKAFPEKNSATVIEALASDSKRICDYARFLFDNDYSLYSAKQWGISPSKIDTSILARVPLRFNYDRGYFDDEYQVMPKNGYTSFFQRLLDHDNIEVKLNADALDVLKIKNKTILYHDEEVHFPVFYTGPLDELFGSCFGALPYRSLRFELIYEEIKSKQDLPVVAYPQAKDYIRIIEYKKLPVQNVNGTTYEKEYSLPYQKGERNEPYYPVLTKESQGLYEKYIGKAGGIANLYICGRLGDFKYYNMDQALERALITVEEFLRKNVL